jgi:hypothetical protein
MQPKARGLMENRSLPILHKQIVLCVLRASNESRLSGTSLPARSPALRDVGRWAVKVGP